MSLRDRLRRRSTPTGGVATEDGVATAEAPDREQPLRVEANVDLAAGGAEGLDLGLDSFLTTGSTPAASAPGRASGSFYGIVPDLPPLGPMEQLKIDLHRRLIDRLDLKALEEIKDEALLTAQIRDAVAEFLRTENTPLSQTERDEIVEQVVYEITGLGPLEPFFRDPAITDILVNGPRDIYVERRGRLQRVATAFRDDAHLLSVIDRIVSRVGRRVDESSPMVDARLPDGSRVNAIIPPLALDGPVVSIRRFGSQIGMEQLIAGGALTKSMAMLLAGCVHAKLNIIISGGTGSGKTTLLNALSSFIPAQERLITIEDAAELRLQQEHVVRLETRPPNVEGRGEVLARDLVRNALRMRPNRIIIGEVRSAEAVDMLQAMNTGHEGSMATLHANNPRDALARLETMVMSSGTSLPMRALREQIAATIDVVVQVSRLSDGSRRVMSITEITGIEGDTISTNEIFEFRRQGVSEGHVVGRFVPTGIRPSFADRLIVAGVKLPVTMFDEASAEEPADIQLPAPAAGSTALLDPQEVRAAAGAEALQRERRELEQRLNAERQAAERARHEAEALRQQIATLRRERETSARATATATDGAGAEQAARTRRAALALLAFVETLDEVTAAGQRAADAATRSRAEQLSSRTQRLLDALGFSEIPALGNAANELEHEVVRTAPRADAQAPNQVIEVVQRGFRLDGQVVRRAQVVVAS